MRRSQSFLGLLLVSFICLTEGLYAQQTKIRGRVVDSISGEPLPHVNITSDIPELGTISNASGEFFLETNKQPTALSFSFIGYQTHAVSIHPGQYQEIHISLMPQSMDLEAAIITPGPNPAYALIEEVKRRRSYLNPQHIGAVSYNVYNKTQLAINNVDSTYRENLILKRFPFVFDYVDTSAITGEKFLPFFFSEAYSTFYYRSTPKLEREIIRATKVSGIDNQSVSQLTGKMYQKINIYNNFIKVFDPGFVSPLANSGSFYYKYSLIDSTTLDNHWCYQVSFTPKHPNEKTFEGYMWIADSSFAVKQFQLRIAKNVNINYINEFVFSARYKQVSDSVWLPKEEHALVDFTVDRTLPGFLGQKSTYYTQHQLYNTLPDSIAKIKSNVIVKESESGNLANWEHMRTAPLSRKEQGIYQMIDSVKNTPRYERWRKIGRLFGIYHYELGYFELGPYYKTYSQNTIEGHRFRLGGRTSNHFSKTWMVHGYGAYGLKDEEIKYGGGIYYVPKKLPRTSFHLSGFADYEQLGKSPYALTEDNIFASLLSRSSYNKLTFSQAVTFDFLKEWYPGLTHTLTLKHKRIHATENVPFQRPTPDGPLPIESIATSELNLHTRIAKDEKYLRGEFERLKLGTPHPVFKFNITAGLPNVMGSDYTYLKFHTNISDKVPVSPMGYFHYVFDAGYLFGKIPFPLLELHPANETYTFDRYAFNLMNYYEFASDRYASLFFDHHFQGFLLNKIPLIKRLYLREVVSAKVIIGNLRNKHRDLLEFPASMNELTQPYWELSAGIENILRLFRVDAVWRMNYLTHPGAEKFGIRISLQVIL
ncbi:MAG: DUF5686 family protein [Bacteroidales bacterium]